MSSYYEHFTGYGLGPHQSEKSRYSSIIKSVQSKVAIQLSAKHSISSMILVVAGVSFAANIFFAAFGIFHTYAGPQIQMSIAPGNSNERGQGSDDDANSGNVDDSPISYNVVDGATPPKISSEAYVVADADTGEIMLEKNEKAPLPTASVTKLMTAIVTKENVDLHHLATVSASSYGTYGVEGGLGLGEKILTGDLIYPLLLESSNDAAEVLASDFGRDAFLSIMNQKANAIGMENTSYEDPSGLDPKNVSSAYDLFKLGLYTKLHYPDLLDITRVKQYAIVGHSWDNENKFLTYPNFVGGKNGFTTEAKQSTVSFFKIFFRGKDKDSKARERNVIVVLLRSGDRDADTANILTYLSKSVQYAKK